MVVEHPLLPSICFMDMRRIEREARKDAWAARMPKGHSAAGIKRKASY